MPDPHSESERPYNEAWWERELNRNEKLMDKYMAALGDDPDKFEHPQDLYNKVHFGIDPPEYPKADEAKETSAETDLSDAEKKLDEIFGDDDEAEPGNEAIAENESPEGAVEFDEDADDAFDNDPPDNEDYPIISKIARKFAVAVMRVEDFPEDAEVLYLSAGKVGANLAGGHGLGYDDEAICGNIVKCRWALADCEFCREMLGHLHLRTGDARFEQLRHDAEELSAVIRERIARLRKRVWW
jgi:hypothetical protein